MIATVLVLAVGSVAPGCAGAAAEGITRRAVPAALDESVGFLEDPESQRRIEGLLRDPQVQAAARELTGALVGGAIEGVTDEARQAELRQVSARYIEAVTAAASRALRTDLGPAAGAALRSALSPRTRQDLAAFAEQITRTTLDTAAESASRGLQKDLGPAFRAVLEDELGPALRLLIARDLAPALREAMAGEMLPAIGLVSHEVARQIVLGVDAGLEEVRFRDRFATFEVSTWDRIQALVHRGLRVSQIAAWILGLVVIILGVLFGRAILLRRRLDEERLRSERMLLGVLRGLQQGSDKPDIEAFFSHLRERNPDLADDAFLEELARRVSQPTRKPGRPRRRL